MSRTRKRWRDVPAGWELLLDLERDEEAWCAGKKRPVAVCRRRPAATRPAAAGQGRVKGAASEPVPGSDGRLGGGELNGRAGLSRGVGASSDGRGRELDREGRPMSEARR